MKPRIGSLVGKNYEIDKPLARLRGKKTQLKSREGTLQIILQ